MKKLRIIHDAYENRQLIRRAYGKEEGTAEREIELLSGKPAACIGHLDRRVRGPAAALLVHCNSQRLTDASHIQIRIIRQRSKIG